MTYTIKAILVDPAENESYIIDEVTKVYKLKSKAVDYFYRLVKGFETGAYDEHLRKECVLFLELLDEENNLLLDEEFDIIPKVYQA